MFVLYMYILGQNTHVVAVFVTFGNLETFVWANTQNVKGYLAGFLLLFFNHMMLGLFLPHCAGLWIICQMNEYDFSIRGFEPSE